MFKAGESSYVALVCYTQDMQNPCVVELLSISAAHLLKALYHGTVSVIMLQIVPGSVASLNTLSMHIEI